MSTKEYPKPDPKAVAKISRATIRTLPVESSQLAAVGYDPQTQTLAIRFKRGSGAQGQGPLYHYGNVSQAAHKALLDADSVGSFFHSVIKPNPQQYPYVRIDEADDEPRAA